MVSVVLTTSWDHQPIFDDKVYVSVRTKTVCRNDKSIRLSNQMHQIFCLVASRNGSLISKSEIMDALYCDRVDGGAESEKIVDVVLWRIRKLLPKVGLTIKTRWGFGVSLGEVEDVPSSHSFRSIANPSARGRTRDLDLVGAY